MLVTPTSLFLNRLIVGIKCHVFVGLDPILHKNGVLYKSFRRFKLVFKKISLLKKQKSRQPKLGSDFSIGPRGETRTLMAVNRRILNPLRLPFRHPGTVSLKEKTIMPYFLGKV